LKNQVNFVYDTLEDSSEELKHWLFLENVRLQQEKQQLFENGQRLVKEKEEFEREKISFKSAMEVQEKRLCKQKELFEKQWQIVEKELKRMARERELFDKEKSSFAKNKNVNNDLYQMDSGFLFRGVNNAISLKKRYRDLLKIFHPDNETGDEATVLYLTKEYNRLKKQYGID
jgi:hypothetical protein